MKVPDIPHDTLYKFMAIFGLIIFLLSAFLPIYTEVYLKDKYSEEIFQKYKTDLELNEIKIKQIKLNNFLLNLNYSEYFSTNQNNDSQKLINEEKLLSQELHTINITEFEISYNKSFNALITSPCFTPLISENKIVGVEQHLNCRQGIGLNKEEQQAIDFMNNISNFTNDFLKKIQKTIKSQEEILNLQKVDNNDIYLKQEYLKEIRGNLSSLSESEEELLNKKNQKLYNYHTHYQYKIDILSQHRYLFYITSIIGILISLVGFILWYKKQKIIDESLELDLKIKKITYQEQNKEFKQK